MLFGFNDKIWFYRHPVDFRKQIDGLVVVVADQLKQNPTSGQLFIFRNRSGNKIKILWWDTNGFWLFYKRIEKGKFCFPAFGDDAWVLSKDQLSWLLSGLDFAKQKQRAKVTAINFF